MSFPFLQWVRSSQGGGRGSSSNFSKSDSYSKNDIEALKDYVENEGYTVNTNFRKGEELSEYDKWVSDSLDKAINKSKNVDGVFYRGVTVDSLVELNPAEWNYLRMKTVNPDFYKTLPNDDWYETEKYTGLRTKIDNIDKQLIGKTFKEKGFMSTTKDFSETSNYSSRRNKGVVLELHAKKKKGIDVEKVLTGSSYKSEREILFGRNTEYKIKNIKQIDGKVVLVADIL